MSGSSASTPHAPTDGRHGTCPVRCSRNTGSAAPVASQRVLDEARLLEAPVTVALHRYVEGIIAVSREWPLDRSSPLYGGSESRCALCAGVWRSRVTSRVIM
jgi:hypothetical protein